MRSIAVDDVKLIVDQTVHDDTMDSRVDSELKESGEGREQDELNELLWVLR